MKKVLCTLIEYICIIADIMLPHKMQSVQTSQFIKRNFMQHAQNTTERKKKMADKSGLPLKKEGK
ncbi:MAG: hypothetical protein J1F63_00940 [Oscillospiraceae bacterium]|nr:hypothetical protein [Oscillospiraceae bacterium]